MVHNEKDLIPIKNVILTLSLIVAFHFTKAQTLQDIGGNFQASPLVSIYTAKEIITMNPEKPKTQAVAVVNGKVLATGTVKELQDLVGNQPIRIDNTFSDKVIVPGFIAQHDHPVLAALTMASEILSIEDWVLPSGTVKAVKDKPDFMKRMEMADKKLLDQDEPLISWGYHPSFFGSLTKSDLDKISKTRPILVWMRSCHEIVMNTKALTLYQVNQEFIKTWGETPQRQSNLNDGRFWEQGMFAVAPKIATVLATPKKLKEGLEITRDFMHSKGVTFGNEPGGILVKQLQDAVNAIMSDNSMPFRWSFMADGKTLCDKYKDDNQVIEEAEKLESWYYGKTSLAKKQVKLFSDGAIYSQLMQVREPYLDKHKGEWMTDKDVFERAFRIFWDAGYQIHIHVNGDAGLDRVLNTLELNIRRNPRFDHRTVIVHFAVSQKDQVARLAKLNCIVSGNPYYTSALADNYSIFGLGPKRANSMVRMGDVERAGVSYSYHSDMPMAPADPLFLMWCGVNRITTSGRVADPNQRVSREGALKAVTIDAAYSLKMENQIGSIESGKLANFTILDDNPITCNPLEIKNIKVWGTVVEGVKQPVKINNQTNKVGYLDYYNLDSFGYAAFDHFKRIINCRKK
ncbi:amidohydrolase [Tenacibaculum sp. SZ-18]|uniref:amidohydrolase n=1 Tax=Tenacibaculum sp. SZ-18 TaxID=754423 RepID=UPI000C2D225E|nr:amidohydrolase [Tenacibaculum sp. SZ-18]AUC16702.1 amidohydrolase [Tenacibaculum sp. SZ-18]